MEKRGGDWGSHYTEEQVRNVLVACEVDIDYETSTDFLCYCPIHGNRYTPSFSVSKEAGIFICFNPACDSSGTLVDLVQTLKGIDVFKAKRLINRYKNESATPLSRRISDLLEREPEFREFQGNFDRMHEDLWSSEEAIEYLYSRGFEDTTLKDFQVGYSVPKDMIIVPMHDPGGMPIGLIGRSIKEKRFKNSRGLPKSKTLWNLHRAKALGADNLILCEASFDAMRVHQAGYPNVAAILGGAVSNEQLNYINRYFTGVILMTDNDESNKQIYQNCRKCSKKGLRLCKGHNPGRALASKVAGGLEGKRIRWASYEPGVIYPHGAKDAGDMTDNEIKQCIDNAVPAVTYKSWGLAEE